MYILNIAVAIKKISKDMKIRNQCQGNQRLYHRKLL